MSLFAPSAFRKWFIAGVILFFVCPLLFSLTVNRWFAQNEASILASLNETFRTPVQIRRIHYSLLKGILIEDFVLNGGVDPALPSPIRVARISIRPSLALFPHFGFQLGRVTFEEPTFSLRADISDLMKMGRFLNTSPKRDKRFGPFYLRMRLSSLTIVRGKVTLLSPSGRGIFRQEFEGIRLSLGRSWLGGERLDFRGHIAGNPKASFRIRVHLKNPLPEATHVDLLFDCKQFATAYLKPHLGNRLELPNEDLTATLQLRIRKGKAFVSKGKISFQNPVEGKEFLPRLVSLISSSFRYEVQGEGEGERWLLKKLVLKMAGVELKGEGEIRHAGDHSAYNISISSGQISAWRFRRLLPELRITSGHVRLFFALAGTVEKISPYLDMVLEDCAFQDTKRHLSWSKVDGHIRLSRDQLVVDEVWAFLNNFPIRIRGTMTHFQHPRLLFEMSTYPGQVSILRPKNPLNAALRFIGNYDGKNWNGDLWVTHFLYRGQEAEKWKFALHDFTVEDLLFHNFSSALFEGKKLQCQLLVIRQEGLKRLFDHLSMRQASFFISGEPSMIRCELLEGISSGGKLFLQGWVDTRQFPTLSWMVTGSIADANMVSLFRRFERHYPVSGRLFAEGTWTQQKKSLQFLGRFRIAEGVIGPTVPLQRFADETGIEPLRQIQFHEFSGHVAFHNGDLDLDNLKILSDQAELLANVKVRGEGLTGMLSAKFPEASVRKSSDLRGLLHYVGEKDWVDFDFRVAGSLGVPRIQWLSGEFKRKVEAKLSPALRKQLAREMEKVLSAKGVSGTSE